MERAILLPGGDVTFTTRADDGVRVWLDDVLIVDQWLGPAGDDRSHHPCRDAGMHRVTVEYYEDRGKAFVSVRW